MYILKCKIQNLMFVVILLTLSLVLIPTAYAHVVVKPNQAGVGTFQTFTVGVPNEKEVATVAVRLEIPEGLNHVTPNVKPGWNISVTTSGEGEEAKVTEISWSGGTIPAGQRDEFIFSAQVPNEASQLAWKAYQTYQNGEIVSWDQDPNAPQPSDSTTGTTPYSVTKVVNDLQSSTVSEVSTHLDAEDDKTSVIFSAGALLVAFAALGISLRKKS